MSAKPRIWYYGTTLMEAQKIVEGDHTVFNTGGGTFYKKVRGLNQAIIAAERAIGSDADQPAIVELLIKDQSHDSGNRVKIKSTRIVSAAEILRRTGHTFENIDTGELLKGVITRASNQVYTVACETGCYQCRLRGKWKSVADGVRQVAVGDRVKIKAIDEKNGVIQAILRRTNQYGRKRAGKSSHTIVANIDRLIIVSAVKQPPIWQKMLDTYLVIAEAFGIRPLICINKIDLIENRMPILSLLSAYEQVGYDTLITSTITGEGIVQLQQWMKNKVSALVGLSGVGKSALLNAIQPGLRLRTGEYNSKRKEGRHTTVTTELLKLTTGGFVADTPGIRDLSLMDVEVRVMDSYFPEMRQLQQKCERNPCSHLHEVGCAVKAALEAGHIAEARYKSYAELRNEAAVIKPTKARGTKTTYEKLTI